MFSSIGGVGLVNWSEYKQNNQISKRKKNMATLTLTEIYETSILNNLGYFLHIYKPIV